MKSSSFFAFIGGALVGAAVALLLAPEKGEVTRKKIIDSAEKPIDELKNMAKKATHQAGAKTKAGVNDVEEVVHKAGKKVKKGVRKVEKAVDNI